jgi:MFS family permease
MGDGEKSTNRHLQSGGMLAPFAYPGFRSIWFANLSANLGASLQGIGAAWLMTSLTPSHQMLGLIQSSATIPIMLFGVFAGAIADNYNRRMVMLTSQVAMLVISAVLALLTWLDLITPWPLLVLTLLLGIGIALNSPAWQASVREQVGIRDLPQAVSLNTIAFNLARTAGPALGGLVISLWSVSAAFAINAICRPPLILAVFRWRSTAPPPVKNPMLPAIATGIRFCAGSSPVRRILLRGLVLGFGIAGYHALLPAVVRYQVKGSETQFGALLAVFGLGSILAALVIGPARRRWGTERVLMLATAGFVVAQLVLAHATSVATALPATFIAGGAWVACLTTVNVAMQLRSPNAILGRCLSIYQTITFGGMAVGSYLWGLVADWRGLPFALQAAAVFLASTLLLLRLFAPMPGRDEGRVDADTGEIAPM